MPPTPYAAINAVLRGFETRIRAALGEQFAGLYLYGSLALGDFDPNGSDIDFIAATQAELSAPYIEALRQIHAAFDGSGSPWAGKIEAAYIPLEAFQHTAPTTAAYPQVEKGTGFFTAPLEIGWAFQLHTLRQHGITISGPEPRAFIPPVSHQALRAGAQAITAMWLDDSRDPDWIAWASIRENQAFVVLTLCRFLYTLETGDVASKPKAALWAKASTAKKWRDLIEKSLQSQHDAAKTPPQDVEALLDLLRFTGKQVRGD